MEVQASVREQETGATSQNEPIQIFRDLIPFNITPHFSSVLAHFNVITQVILPVFSTIPN